MDPLLSRLQHEIAAAIAGITNEDLIWHPSGKWCAAEVLEHLLLTYTGTTKGCRRVLQGGLPQVSAATWKNRAQSILVTAFGYMPDGRESPTVARPRGLAPASVVADIDSKLNEMDEVLSQRNRIWHENQCP